MGFPPFFDGLFGRNVAECALRDMPVVDGDIAVQGGLEVFAGVESAGLQDILDAPVEAPSAAIDRAAPRPDPSKGGRPPFPTELMARVLVLQQLYSLSDEQMECQLLDRLSFQRFAGLRRSSQIPDRTTLWTFRERLF